MVGVGVVTCGCGGRKVDGEAGHEAWTRNIFREDSNIFSVASFFSPDGIF